MPEPMKSPIFMQQFFIQKKTVTQNYNQKGGKKQEKQMLSGLAFKTYQTKTTHTRAFH